VTYFFFGAAGADLAPPLPACGALPSSFFAPPLPDASILSSASVSFE
jgi:hypothetical protein